MLLARSLIGALPEGYDVTADGFSCPWLLRYVLKGRVRVTAAQQPDVY